MERDLKLARARRHIFSMGLNDSGARVALRVMEYGLAKIHCLQEYLGYEASAFFLGTPDLTITRNVYRFTQGIGYGGLLSWGSGHTEMIPLDLKPNACGMLIGGIKNPVECTRLINSLEELKNEPGAIQGTNLKWDFNASNHFINIFRVAENRIDLPPYIFVIHGAGDEFRGDNHGQFGLYIDNSKILKSMAQVLETPFGPIHYLTGADAREYFKFYQAVEEFTRQRRIHVAGKLFAEFTIIADQNHQGLVNLNEMILGCHKFGDKGELYPLMLRADRPGYLLSGKPNLTPEQMDILGFTSRAKELGIYEQLLKVNVLPHGGGYDFPELLDVENVHELNGHRYFELSTMSGIGRKIVEHLKEIPYEYRGRQVLTRTLELHLGEVEAALVPLFTLKI